MAATGTSCSTVLFVDDSEEDTILFEHAIKKSGLALRALTATDVSEAMDYLEAHGDYADRSAYPLPDVIFTDLKMPRMDGFEFLDWLRARPECASIPKFVLSSSDMSEDITKSYDLGASAFLTKPSDIRELTSVVKAACQFCCRQRNGEAPTHPAE